MATQLILGACSGRSINTTFSSGCQLHSYPTSSSGRTTYTVMAGAGALTTEPVTGRNYYDFVPAVLPGSVPGLLLVFHGTLYPVNGTPAPSGLDPVPPPGSPASNAMESNGHFVVVYLNGEIHNDADTTYIFGYQASGARAWDQRNPSLNTDLPYVRGVYAALEGNVCFDTGKVFVYGFSAGGFFSDNLASFQPISGVTIQGAGIDHGGLIQGVTFINTSTPSAAGARRVFFNTNQTDTTVTETVTKQAQGFWQAGGVATMLIETGTDHTPMTDGPLAQMLTFLSP